jgi:hypothetical protein
MPNRNIMIMSGDIDSPEKPNGGKNGKKGSHFKKRRESSGDEAQNNPSLLHTEIDEQAVREQILDDIQEEERLFKETLQAL